MIQSDIAVERLDVGGVRYYHPQDYKESALCKPSSTSILNIINKPYLTKWYMDKGLEARRLMNCAGMVGDITHEGIDMLVTHGTLEKNDIIQLIINHEFKDWANEYQSIDSLFRAISRRIDAYMVFIEERQPKFLAHEVMLYHFDLSWAGTADAVVEMPLTPQEAKRFGRKSCRSSRWLIDYKTGNENKIEHMLQLVSYAILWNEIFPDKRINYVGGLYLKDTYRGVPKYKFVTHQVTGKLISKWLQVLQMWNSLHSDEKGEIIHPKIPIEPTTFWKIV